MTRDEFLDSLRRGREIQFGASRLSPAGEIIGECLATSLDPLVPVGEVISYGIETTRPAAGWASGVQTWFLALSRDVRKVVAELRTPDGTPTLHVSGEAYPVRTLTGTDLKTQHRDLGTGARILVGAVLSLGFGRGTIEIASGRGIPPGIVVEFMGQVLEANR
jgi:hypothetical protein